MIRGLHKMSRLSEPISGKILKDDQKSEKLGSKRRRILFLSNSFKYL